MKRLDIAALQRRFNADREFTITFTNADEYDVTFGKDEDGLTYTHVTVGTGPRNWAMVGNALLNIEQIEN